MERVLVKYALLLYTACSILLIILSLPVYFFQNFADYLSSLVTGDIDIHVHVVGDPDRAKFLELNETVGLQQDVIAPTYESGHTLDLIISRQCENLVKTTPVSDYHITDH